MSDLPVLTIGVCTYKRPWYAIHAILGLSRRLGYDGVKRFHIADGGSSEEDIRYYRSVLEGYDVTVEVTDTLASMVNSCARNSGELFMVSMDDYVLTKPVNITPDVRFMLRDPEVGCIRMSRLAFWGSCIPGEPQTYAELKEMNGLHWWKLDRKLTTDNYMCSMGVHIYHRRFWDYYGDIPAHPGDNPGMSEINGCTRFNLMPNGPTIAIPMRFGEDSAENAEPFWHLGMWHTDEYTQVAGKRL